MCFNSGRRRSDVVANLLAGLFDQLGGGVEELFLANYGSWIEYGCARYNGVECDKCRFCEAGTDAQSKYISLTHDAAKRLLSLWWEQYEAF